MLVQACAAIDRPATGVDIAVTLPSPGHVT